MYATKHLFYKSNRFIRQNKKSKNIIRGSSMDEFKVNDYIKTSFFFPRDGFFLRHTFILDFALFMIFNSKTSQLKIF